MPAKPLLSLFIRNNNEKNAMAKRPSRGKSCHVEVMSTAWTFILQHCREPTLSPSFFRQSYYPSRRRLQNITRKIKPTAANAFWGQSPISSSHPSFAYFLWLSVNVMPCADTLKWTTVEMGDGSWVSVRLKAFCTAWYPVRDSISTEFRYHTLHAATEEGKDSKRSFITQQQANGHLLNKTKQNVNFPPL